MGQPRVKLLLYNPLFRNTWHQKLLSRASSCPLAARQRPLIQMTQSYLLFHHHCLYQWCDVTVATYKMVPEQHARQTAFKWIIFTIDIWIYEMHKCVPWPTGSFLARWTKKNKKEIKTEMNFRPWSGETAVILIHIKWYTLKKSETYEKYETMTSKIMIVTQVYFCFLLCREETSPSNYFRCKFQNLIRRHHVRHLVVISANCAFAYILKMATNSTWMTTGNVCFNTIKIIQFTKSWKHKSLFCKT